MRLLILTYLILLSHLAFTQDSRDFYGSNTYFETAAINDSVFNLYKSRDVLLDSKTQILELSINDSLIRFSNQLDKSDKKVFTQGAYSIRIKTNGHHFENSDNPDAVYTIDKIKLMDVRRSLIRVKAEFKIYKVKKSKKRKLISQKEVVIKINKDELQGILFGTKYSYDPKDNIKKAKVKDAIKFTAATIAVVAAGGVVFIYRAILFPSIF